MTTLAYRFACRRRSAADWTSLNEVLLKGEIGVETDTDKFKFGDGTTGWNALAYSGNSGGDGGILIQGGSKSLTAPLTTSFVVDGIAAAGYTITGWELLVSPPGSLTLDVRKGANISVTPASITPSGNPAVSAATSATGGITGWTSVDIARGNSLTVAVSAVSGVKWFSLLLKATRT